MRKKVFIVFILIIILLVYTVYWAFFDMNKLPKGELISEVESSNNTYAIKAYLTNGGATTSYAIRGELNFNKSRKRPKNIYWNYREEEAFIEWENDNTVIINGIKLNIPDEKFDFRRNK